MVVGDIGRGHHQRRNAQCRQLADGGGTGPADHQVRRPHHGIHVVDVLPELNGLRNLHALLLQKLLHRWISGGTGGVDVVERRVLRLQGDEIGHLPVHASGAQGAPEGHHQGPVVGQAQLFPGLLLRQLEKAVPDGGAGDQYLLRVLIVLAAGLKAHHNPVRVGFQHFRGQPRHGIGLVDRRGNARLGGGLYHGVAGVAAGTHHHIRLKLPENRPGLMGRPDQVPGGNQVVTNLLWTKGAVKVGDVNGLERIARLGNQVFFQTALRPYKQKLNLRVLLMQQLGQRNGGVHMSRCAAAGKQNPPQ